jgi:hypothetical protein
MKLLGALAMPAAINGRATDLMKRNRKVKM